MGVFEIGMEEEEVDVLEDTPKIQQMKKRIPLTIDYLAKTTYLPIETLREESKHSS